MNKGPRLVRVFDNGARRCAALLMTALMLAGPAWSQGISQSITQSITQSIARSQSVNQGVTTRNVTESVFGAQRYAAVQPVLAVNRARGDVDGVLLSTTGDALVVTTDDGLSRSWSLLTGQFVAASRLRNPGDVVNISVADQLQAGLLRRGGVAELLDLTTGQVLRSMRAPSGGNGTVSPDTVDAVTLGRGGGLIDLSRGSVSPLSGADTAGAAAFHPTQRLIAISERDGAIRVINTAGGVSATLNGTGVPVDNVAWQSSGRVVSALSHDGTLRWHDLTSPNAAPRTARLPQGHPAAIAWDQTTQRTLAASADGTMRLFDGSTGVLLRAFTEDDNRVDYLAIYPGGRFAFSGSRSGQLKLWDIEAGVSRAQIVLTQHGWLVVDSLGRFDGNDAGLADVKWQAAQFAVPIDRFARYREPGLLGRIVAGSISFDKSSLTAIRSGIFPPPTVTFTTVPPSGTVSAVAQLTVRAEDRGAGLSSVVLFRNGRVIGSVMAQTGRNVATLDATFELPLVPGPNSFRVVATDRGGVESEPAATQINLPEPGGPGALHIVSIAIDRYRDSRIRPLGLSVADAAAMEAALGGNGRSPFAQVLVHRLYNEAATHDAILSTLGGLRDLSPRDTVVIFMAGHGIAIDGDWFLAPHDAAIAGAGIEHGVNVVAIKDAIARTPARQVLVLIDSCESGQAASRLSGFFERGSLAALGREGGVALLAATRADQPAYETSQLGHGVLTASLLQGLRGDADPGRHDGRISAYRLVAYAESNVPQLARRYAGGLLQVPVAVARGGDFVLATY